MTAKPPRLPAVAMDGIQYLVQALADQQMHCVLRFGGRLDAARLERAVRATIAREPVLGCRLAEQHWWPYWEPVADLETRILCPVLEVGEPEPAALASLVQPMGWEQGPQLRVLLLRGPEDDTLCVSLSHVVADGGGLLEYAKLLAAAYRALQHPTEQRPAAGLPAADLRAARGMGQVLRRIPWPARLWATRRGKMPRSAWRAPLETLSGSDPTQARAARRAVLLRRLPAEPMAALRRLAHTRGVSFNDLLLAATFRALCSVLDPSAGVPLPIQVPVNLRRYLPDGRAGGVANLSGSSYPVLVREPGEAFDASVARAHAALLHANEGLPGVGHAVFLHASTLLPWALVKPYASRTMSRMQYTHLLPTLSNMGILWPEWVDFGGPPLAQAYGVGPVLYPPGLLVAASTFGGVLTLAASICDTAGERVMIERCLDSIVADLEAAARTAPADPTRPSAGR